MIVLCPHCSSELEVAKPGKVACWNCRGHVLVTRESFAVEPKPKHGLFSTLVDKYKAHKQRVANEDAFREELFAAVSDGVLTAEEVQMIAARKVELGLTDDFICKHSAKLLATASGAAIKDEVCTHEAYECMRLMAANLGTSLEQHERLFRDLGRANRRYQLRHEPLIPLVSPNMILDSGEFAYWREPATLYEERVVSRRYEGGSSGVSMRVMKGMSVRVGAHRGQLVTETGNLPVASGELYLTNRRFLFAGDNKSFSALLKKIIHIEPAHNGIRFAESNRQKPQALLFNQPNGDLLFEVLSRIMHE